jgi:hypothetical protein
MVGVSLSKHVAADGRIAQMADAAGGFGELDK